MSDPVYVVSGFPRSGTSMMMRCLEAGGLSCVYNTRGDANRNRNTLISDYIPNPHGFYENAPIDKPEMWTNFRGKVVKVVRDNIGHIPLTEKLQTVYMTRNPVEIRRSYYGILSGPHPESTYSFLENYHAKVESDVEMLRQFGPVVVIDYSWFVFHSTLELKKLGWGIDIEKAVATVDLALYRHRGVS